MERNETLLLSTKSRKIEKTIKRKYSKEDRNMGRRLEAKIFLILSIIGNAISIFNSIFIFSQNISENLKIFLIVLFSTGILIFSAYIIGSIKYLNETKDLRDLYKVQGKIISDIDPYGEENWNK